jgi:DNA-directed RNA polymerase sigma subunit (sigma70/sigma32)
MRSYVEAKPGHESPSLHDLTSILAGPNATFDPETRARMNKKYAGLLPLLPEREANIIRYRCGLMEREYSYEEIGQIYHVSSVTVRTYEKKAHKMLRKAFINEGCNVN